MKISTLIQVHPSAIQDLEFGSDDDGRAKSPVKGTGHREEAVDPLGHQAMLRRGLKLEEDVDSPDDKDLVLQFDLAHHLRDEAVTRRGYLARLQRASKGPQQSTAGGRHDMVDGRGMRLVGARGATVVLGDGSVRPEDRRLNVAWQRGPAHGTGEPLNDHLGTVCDVGHCTFSSGCFLGGRSGFPVPQDEKDHGRDQRDPAQVEGEEMRHGAVRAAGDLKNGIGR